MKTKLKLIALSLLGGLFLWTSAVLAIGQMSKPITVDLAIRGQEVTETLLVYNSEKTSQTFGLLADGAVAGWAKFYLPDNFEQEITTVEVPAEGTAEAVVVITVPSDTPNGLYEGSVAVTSAPTEGSGDGSSVGEQQRVDRTVSINVTDQEIIKLVTGVIPVTYEVEPNANLQIKLLYDNQGNIALKPGVQLKIADADGKSVANTIFPYPEDEDAVKPGQQKTITVEWPTGQMAQGRYRADVTILNDNEAVDNDSFRFTVGKAGMVAGAAFESSTALMVGATTLGAIVIALLMFGIYLVSQNRKRNKAGNGGA